MVEIPIQEKYEGGGETEYEKKTECKPDRVNSHHGQRRKSEVGEERSKSVDVVRGVSWVCLMLEYP